MVSMRRTKVFVMCAGNLYVVDRATDGAADVADGDSMRVSRARLLLQL